MSKTILVLLTLLVFTLTATAQRKKKRDAAADTTAQKTVVADTSKTSIAPAVAVDSPFF